MSDGLTDTQDRELRETARLARAIEMSLKLHLTECAEQRKLFAERMQNLSDDVVTLDHSVTKLTDRIVKVAAFVTVGLLGIVGTLLSIVYSHLSQ